jgi:tripartite-type tricarboxylate transporter receptor subunit TctC
VSDTFNALFAPAGTPREIVERLSKEARAAMQRPEVRDAARKAGYEIVAGTPEKSKSRRNSPQRRASRRSRSMIRVLTAVAAVLVLTAAPAPAQEWPAKPVRIVVPYGAGGAADTLGRVFAEALSTAFGKQFFVENRPGGGSIIGSEAVARAAPDGTTLMLSGMSTHVLAPAMNKSAGFDPLRDFTHVAYFGGAPNAFVVHPSFGVASFKDFLARAKGDADVPYVSPGVGSVGNLVAEYLAAKEHLKLTHIAYRGGAAALTDLVAGHVKVGMMSYSTAREQVRAGKLVPLAMSSAERPKDFPDVPTLKELGYPDLVATTWWALSGPARLPPEIVEKINREVNKSLDLPQVRKQLEREEVKTQAMTPAEVTAFVQSEVAKWVPVVARVVAK